MGQLKAGWAYVELGVGDKLTGGLKRARARLKAFGEGVTRWGTRLFVALAAPAGAPQSWQIGRNRLSGTTSIMAMSAAAPTR